ncbi:peptidase C53 family protein [Heterostelium album PN500]|uniref:Peptidase C53 family protein n=1 Tax=Heterostelium pallidum (strain ATCC 26659 / Pp 5 / PN500) TaxID=670386 RepID=D3BGT9_HETP5|nr:peptidase C53 family protein [Heterostelium album PN500]EFA79323.1 peptidase C53 family protein [Heterostelium album PN500]|eukprot:XP_020431444.1 peptidase C53 family protein [Heterostelium album PN500]
MQSNKSIFVCLFLLLVVALCGARHFEHLRWQLAAEQKLCPMHPIPFRIFIKQQNVDSLKDIVRAVTDPKSQQYGQYLTIDEITEVIRPTDEAIKTIDAWLRENNAKSIQYNRNLDSVHVVMPRKNVEKMLSVQMQKFQYAGDSSRVVIRSATDAVLDHSVAQHIDLITGISHFPISQRRSANTKLIDNTLTLDASSSSSSSSSGLSILSMKGLGDNFKMVFQPNCAPSCNGKYYPVDVTVQTLDAFQPSVDLEGVTPNCTVAGGQTTCTIYVPTFPYVQTQITLTQGADTIQWPFNFVSTPVVVPQSIKSQYGIPQNYIVTNPKATQCVVEFEQQYYSPSDLVTFFQQMGLPQPTTPVQVIGYNDETNPGIEASLDIQYMMAISTGSPTTFWSIYANSSVEIDDILQWEVAIGNTDDAPLVNSLSYGMTEINVDTYLGQGYLARSDIEFVKLASRGITVIIASGDSGASDLGPPPMGSGSCAKLFADWPSQSPYVTAVSSTYFTPLAEPICYIPPSQGGVDCLYNPLGEISVSVDHGMMWTTGGGISNTSQSPYYQQAAVEQYFNQLNALKLTPPSNLYNATGRSYPDVATVGHNLWIINGGEFLGVDGTSASAPIFGGLVTILNDIRLNAGNPPLGFFNPLLYQIAQDHPDAFYDVIVGNNRCGVTDSLPTCCTYGWSAVPGFDQVSGLGRPNMEVLMRVINDY